VPLARLRDHLRRGPHRPVGRVVSPGGQWLTVVVTERRAVDRRGGGDVGHAEGGTGLEMDERCDRATGGREQSHDALRHRHAHCTETHHTAQLHGCREYPRTRQVPDITKIGYPGILLPDYYRHFLEMWCSVLIASVLLYLQGGPKKVSHYQ